MSTTKKTLYSSVADMVRATSDSPELIEELEKRLTDREMIRQLLILRAESGVSQEDIAKTMHCSQSRISKLEASDDADLRFGDLVRYVSAIGWQPQIVLFKKGSKLSDQVKFHFFRTKEIMEKLVKLSETDPDLAKGVGKFFGEIGLDFVTMICDKAKNLPENGQKMCPFITISDDCDAENDDADQPSVVSNTRVKREPVVA